MNAWIAVERSKKVTTIHGEIGEPNQSVDPRRMGRVETIQSHMGVRMGGLI